MQSDTITTGLGDRSKLRRLRLLKSMGLLELSKHTRLSPALLSKLERDLMHPTLLRRYDAPRVRRVGAKRATALVVTLDPRA